MSNYWLTKAGGDILGTSNTTDFTLTQGLANINRRFAVGYMTPTTANSTATLTASQIRGGIIQSTPGSGITLTMPTAALLIAADPDAVVGRGYNFYIINLNGSNTVTLATGTGGTLVGNAVVHVSASSQFYVSYTNVTSGQQAVTIYRLAV